MYTVRQAGKGAFRVTLYHTLRSYIMAHPRLERIIPPAVTLLPGIVYTAYPLFLLYLFLAQRYRLVPCILFPAGGFLLATVVRALLNFPRPYEVMEIPPLTQKDTKGKSFPSRHAACAAVIAVTVWSVLPWAGVALGVVAVLISLSRVLSGVHFIRDVVTGLALGAVIGLGAWLM